jgi:hypothetical protein
MDLNRLGAGKKFIEKVIAQNNVGTMGWLPTQQKQNLDNRKNCHTPKTRKK